MTLEQFEEIVKMYYPHAYITEDYSRTEDDYHFIYVDFAVYEDSPVYSGTFTKIFQKLNIPCIEKEEFESLLNSLAFYKSKHGKTPRPGLFVKNPKPVNCLNEIQFLENKLHRILQDNYIII